MAGQVQGLGVTKVLKLVIEGQAGTAGAMNEDKFHWLLLVTQLFFLVMVSNLRSCVDAY